MNWSRLSRKLHSWTSILGALPVLVIICTGILLMLKKDFVWIQPPTQDGTSHTPTASFAAILQAAQSEPEAGIKTWDDIDRLDIRPSQGVIKVRSASGWEVQVDAASAQVLQSAFRRSDFIEAIHDGSFFHSLVKRWIFLPTGVSLLILWITGMYLWAGPRISRYLRERRHPSS